MTKIIPFGANILVLPIEKKQILLSDTNPLCEYGTVVAVGSDVKHIKVGQQIGYTIWGVNRLEIEDKKYYFIPEDFRFILGIIENNEQSNGPILGTIEMSGELASQVQGGAPMGNRSSGSL